MTIEKQQIPPDLLFSSVYMSVKNTLLSEFFSEALVILVKKLVNLFHDLLHNITLNLSKTNKLLTLLLRLRGQA